MTQALEKLTANPYTLWCAILFAATGGWCTCAYLGAISKQIEVQGQVQLAHNNMTDYRLDKIEDSQKDAHSWQIRMATQLDSHDTKIQQILDNQAK